MNNSKRIFLSIIITLSALIAYLFLLKELEWEKPAALISIFMWAIASSTGILSLKNKPNPIVKFSLIVLAVLALHFVLFPLFF